MEGEKKDDYSVKIPLLFGKTKEAEEEEEHHITTTGAGTSSFFNTCFNGLNALSGIFLLFFIVFGCYNDRLIRSFRGDVI